MSQKLQIHKHSQAKEDLAILYAYLSVRSESAARNFLRETRKAFDLILSMPGIGRRWESPLAAIKGMRFTSVSRRFRDYLIFYRPVADGIQIVTVVHGARDLGLLIDSLQEEDSEN